MVAEDDKAIYFRFGTELVDGWERSIDRIHEHAKKTQEKLDRSRFKLPPVDYSDALASQQQYQQKSQSLHEKFFNGRGEDFARMAKEQKRWDDEISKAQQKADAEALAQENRFQAQLQKSQERNQAQLAKAQQAAFARMAKEQIRADEEFEAAKQKANSESLSRQNKAQADAERASARHHAELLKQQKAFAEDSHNLELSLQNAWGAWNTRLAREAEESQARAAKAVESGGKKMEDALLKTGKGAVELARGLTYLGAANEETAQAALKVIATFEGLHNAAKGGITIVRGLTEVWAKYRDIKLAVAAAEAAAAAAAAAGAASGSGTGGRGGSVTGVVAGAVGTGVGGTVLSSAGRSLAARAAAGLGTAVGGATGVAALGVAGVAITGILGTLYYFDKNFKAGVDKFLYGMTDAEQKLLKRIDANQGEADELRGRFGRTRADELTVQGANDDQLRLQARAAALADKSIPLDERSLRGDVAGNAALIADRRAKLAAAQAEAADYAANAQGNPNSPQALAAAELSAQKVVDLTREIGQLEQERLGLTERIKQAAVDAATKQLDAARETAALAKQTADEAQRTADIEANKYRTDLERFGQASPIEQEKLRRIKGKLDAGETLSAEESRIASGYNEFSDQAAAADRSRAIAAGGESLFGAGEARVADAQAQAAASNAAALGAQGKVAKIDNEIRILMEANTQDLARQIAESLEPVQTQLIDEIIRQIDQRRTAEAKAAADRRTKDAISAGRS
jgi:hypothetical protein